MVGREGGHLIGGLAGADVVSLVDDDEDRLAIGPAAPERCQDALCRDRLLAGCAQRAEVDDETAWPARRHEILNRSLVTTRPDRPAVDAEVA